MFQIISHILHFIGKISYIIPKPEWSEHLGGTHPLLHHHQLVVTIPTKASSHHSLGILGGSHILGSCFGFFRRNIWGYLVRGPPNTKNQSSCKKGYLPRNHYTNPCIQCIMFRQPRFLLKFSGDFLSSATFSGVQVVWGRYNFTRIHVSNRYLGPLAVSGMTIQVPYRIPF